MCFKVPRVFKIPTALKSPKFSFQKHGKFLTVNPHKIMKQITYFQYLKFPFESGRGRIRRPKQDPAGKTLDLEAPCLESRAHNGMIWVLADSGSPTPHAFFLWVTVTLHLWMFPLQLTQGSAISNTLHLHCDTDLDNVRKSQALFAGNLTRLHMTKSKWRSPTLVQAIRSHCKTSSVKAILPRPAACPYLRYSRSSRLSCMGLCVLTLKEHSCCYWAGILPSGIFSLGSLLSKTLAFFLKTSWHFWWVGGVLLWELFYSHCLGRQAFL